MFLQNQSYVNSGLANLNLSHVGAANDVLPESCYQSLDEFRDQYQSGDKEASGTPYALDVWTHHDAQQTRRYYRESGSHQREKVLSHYGSVHYPPPFIISLRRVAQISRDAEGTRRGEVRRLHFG